MMDVSDVCYYRIIKDQDIQANDFHDQLSLLYDSNRGYIKNIALFTEEGEALDIVPEAIVKGKVKPRVQEWFQKSLQKSENQHFCAPHVQINVSGVYEVQHLEQTLRKMSRQLKKLMEYMDGEIIVKCFF